MRNDFELAGRRCHTYTVGDGGPVVFWGTMSGSKDADEMIALIQQSEDEMESFTLFVYECDDWFSDFSPWSFDAGFQKFGDGGPALRDWIVNEAIPYADAGFPRNNGYAAAGYSLAGLFALWVYYDTGIFNGVACCSGSLWFEGWDKYADGAKGPDNGVVYMSLGGKEPGSGNALTASIGVQYHKQKKRIEKDSKLRAFNFVTNSGGHFSDPNGRVLKGLKWLVDELSVY